MKHNGTKRRRLVTIVFVLLIPLAFFYLFVVPALVANYAMQAGLGNVLFAAFLYAQFWMITTEYAYNSAAALYGFRRRHLWPHLPGNKEGRLALVQRTSRGSASPSSPVSGWKTAALCLASYAFTLYGFSVAYTFLSSIDPDSFIGGPLGLWDAFYFSVVTAATVGYGDITPKSSVARGIVVLEILASLAYAVFFFSVLASRVRQDGTGAVGELRNDQRGKE